MQWNENLEDETGRSHVFLMYVERPGGGTQVFSQQPSRYINNSSLSRATNVAASAYGYSPHNALVSSVSYLGHMTKEEWTAP